MVKLRVLISEVTLDYADGLTSSQAPYRREVGTSEADVTTETEVGVM